MPRTARASAADYCYHVLNRGNGSTEVFHEPADYDSFLGMIAEASVRTPMRVLAYCLMPNHFHLVLRPHNDGDLSRWMQWLLTSHVRRYHRKHGSSGHVWQGRFKAFPCQEDAHLLAVLRYVEWNALRAGLVTRTEDWPHGSLHARRRGSADPVGLEPIPEMPAPAVWARTVNRPMRDAELTAIRNCVARGSPFGGAEWSARAASELGLESSLRPRGRPRKTPG